MEIYATFGVAMPQTAWHCYFWGSNATFGVAIERNLKILQEPESKGATKNTKTTVFILTTKYLRKLKCPKRVVYVIYKVSSKSLVSKVGKAQRLRL